MSEKEVSLLEERIKRSGKIIEATVAARNKSLKTPSPVPTTPEPQEKYLQPFYFLVSTCYRIEPVEVEKPLTPVDVPVVESSPPRSSIPKFSGPFSLDMGRYRATPRSSLKRPRVARPDLSSLEQDVKMPEYTTSK